MEIITKSGAIQVNRRTPYGKWLAAYCTTGAWTGWSTIQAMWKNAQNKPQGVTWAAWGHICGNIRDYANLLAPIGHGE
jgi:hypothetical protein